MPEPLGDPGRDVTELFHRLPGAESFCSCQAANDVVAFVVIEGALEFLDPQGHSMGLENWKTLLERYYRFCEENHRRPVDLSRFE